jgi:hypothetical protein
LFETGNGNHIDYTKRWQKPGDEKITNIPALIYPTNIARDEFYKYSEALIERGDHIRLRDLGLDYSINKIPGIKWVKDVGIYFYMTNIGILWKANKHGIDPDAYVLGDTPQPRGYSAGIKISL